MGRAERMDRRHRSRWPRAILGPLAVLVGVTAATVAGALATGTQVGPVVGGVEAIAAGSGDLLTRFGSLFPLGFAFSAGLVAAVNPCGFVLLPAYLGLFLGDTQGAKEQPGPRLRFQRAVVVGGMVTSGFVLMFALVGVPIGFGARQLAAAFPWVGFAVGVALTLAGAYLLFGGKLYAGWGASLSAKIGGGNARNATGYFTFGIAYGIASLSCTLPIFLAVIGGALTAGAFLDSLLQFLLYGLGMGVVIMALTIAMALFQGALVGGLRRALPYMGVISAGLLLLAGSFIMYYWLTIGELLNSF